jgi:hypothetical protein
MAEELEDGDDFYLDCPACHSRGKFALRRDGNAAVYHCFKAACSLHGGGRVSVNGQRLVEERGSRRRKQKVTPYTGELVALDERQKAFLLHKIGWEAWHRATSRVMWAPGKQRFAFPIFDPMGRRRGWTLRSYNGLQPKALTRMDREEPHLSWYRRHGNWSCLLVVEDIPSAVRAARYIDCVALGGTGVGPDYVQEIAAHARYVIWALDPDATDQALALHRKYSLAFESSRVMVLARDIKDMTEDAVQELLT